MRYFNWLILLLFNNVLIFKNEKKYSYVRQGVVAIILVQFHSGRKKFVSHLGKNNGYVGIT